MRDWLEPSSCSPPCQALGTHPTSAKMQGEDQDETKGSNDRGYGEADEPKSAEYLQHFQQPWLDFFCPVLAVHRYLFSLSYGVLAPLHFIPDLSLAFPLPCIPPAAIKLIHCKITLLIIHFLHIYIPFIWSFYMLYSYFTLHLFLLYSASYLQGLSAPLYTVRF